MVEAKIQVKPRAQTVGIVVLDINGEINAAAEKPLMDAYAQASGAGVKVLALNFGGLDYMNSTGIGLLVTLLIRATRAKQRLVAYGLNNHYRQIFEMTRLNEAITIYDSEAEALAAVGSA